MKFFHNEMFDFEVQIALGSAYYRAADVGERRGLPLRTEGAIAL